MVNKIKSLGQVYTPIPLVNDILDLVDYTGEKILKKHIIDNSCGDGAFLLQIIERYICAYKKKFNSLTGIEDDLATYIHGIEIDTNAYLSCLTKLESYLLSKDISKVNFNIINGDTLTINNFNGKMHYVVGNPPYVRTHNLEDKVVKAKNYKFSNFGMKDLYLIFYEIGFNMLDFDGKLCYITPNSFYSSLAGKGLREYISKTKSLYAIIDLGHYQPFKTSTYTTICAFENNKEFPQFHFSKYQSDGSVKYIGELDIDNVFINGNLILSDEKDNKLIRKIQNYKYKDKNLIEVKNGFATLADNVFIKTDFGFKNKHYTIVVIKASTGEWKKCIFPYDRELKLVAFDLLTDEIKNYIIQHKDVLKNRSLEKNNQWYTFGRTQAIHDVPKYKVTINTTIKDIESIKLNESPSGTGVYSGLYIISNYSKYQIEKVLKTDEFISYVRAIGKQKNGGYYTFSSKELKQFLFYKLENKNE